MIYPTLHCFLFDPRQNAPSSSNFDLSPSTYLPFNHFCLGFAHHPSFALFFFSPNNSFFFFFLWLLAVNLTPSLFPLLPSNLSFTQALVLFLLASSSTFFCTVLQTPELLRSNDNTKDSQDRLWGLNNNNKKKTQIKLLN